MDTIVLSRERRAANDALLQFVRFKAKSVVYTGDQAVQPWRVISGAVALEDVRGEEVRLSGLAMAGDLIGLESLLPDGARLRARAVVPTQLMRWSPSVGQVWDNAEVMRNLLRQQQRNAELLSLRSGGAQERVVKLIRLLGADVSDEAGVALPTLRDMSLITGIAGESICRELKRLRDEGVLRPGLGRMVLLQ